jgi:hypothetical protein
VYISTRRPWHNANGPSSRKAYPRYREFATTPGVATRYSTDGSNPLIEENEHPDLAELIAKVRGGLQGGLLNVYRTMQRQVVRAIGNCIDKFEVGEMLLGTVFDARTFLMWCGAGRVGAHRQAVVPPRFSPFSMSSTFAPRLPASAAAANPDPPPPTTMRSNVSIFCIALPQDISDESDISQLRTMLVS